MSAQDLGWGPPGGLSASDLTRVDVAGIQLNVRREVAPLFAELVRWLTLERQKAGVPGLSSSGGYNPRRISGTNVWSNHAWGLAADFNANTNPYGYGAGTDMPPGTSAKAKSLGMRWGGDYSGKRDAMHFEVIVSPAEAARLVAEISGQVEIDVALLPVLKLGDENVHVGVLQRNLKLDDDKVFGPATDAAVRHHQEWAHLDVDGVVGRATWCSLWRVKP